MMNTQGKHSILTVVTPDGYVSEARTAYAIADVNRSPVIRFRTRDELPGLAVMTTLGWDIVIFGDTVGLEWV